MCIYKLPGITNTTFYLQYMYYHHKIQVTKLKALLK